MCGFVGILKTKDDAHQKREQASWSRLERGV